MNVIFVAAILGMIALWVAQGLSGKPQYSAGWTFGILFMYAIIVAALLLPVLLVHAVAARTIAFLKWPFVLFVLTYLALSVGDPVSDRLTGMDTVRLHVLNESGELIDRVNIFGRGESVRIDAIPADSGVVVSYRGRKHNYRARDPYSNRVTVSWYAAGRWRERVLVSEYTGIGDSLFIVFPALDSVLVDGRRAAVSTK